MDLPGLDQSKNAVRHHCRHCFPGGRDRLSQQSRAKRAVSPATHAIMLEYLEKPLHNPVSVRPGPGGAVVMTDRMNAPERLQALIDLAS
jgi:hypothetical protein